MEQRLHGSATPSQLHALALHLEAVSQAEVLRGVIEAFSWPLRSVTVSIGVVTLDDFALQCFDQQCLVKTERDLVSRADKALYQAKERGRNCVVSYRE